MNLPGCTLTFYYTDNCLVHGGLVTELCLTLCDPMDCSPPGFSVHGILRGKNTGVGSHSLYDPEDLPDPGIKSKYPALQADSLPSEPPGKP